MIATTPTRPSTSIAPYPIGRMSLSRSTIFDVVPVDTRAWKPEMAPQAMVMNTNGNSGPGITGPPPPMYCENAGACSFGFRIITPMTRKAMVPIFMNVLRYARGVSSIHTGSTDAAMVYSPIAIVIWCLLSRNQWLIADSATFFPNTTARNMTVTPITVASRTRPVRHRNM